MNVLSRCSRIIVASLAFLSFAAEPGGVAIRASFVIKVNDRNASAKTLVDAAQKASGYFSNLGDDYVTVKVPNSAVETYLSLCDSQGLVVDRYYEAIDQSRIIAEKEVKLKARRNLLKDHFEMLQQSTAGSVLTVEKAIAELTAEIESLEADLKVLRHDLDFAEIRVDFRFRERRAPLKSATSLFGWVNKLNLIDLKEEFEHGAF
jgi:hypothetical protein